eukprot:CAMPEP_0203740150 /NCGR_PEP_ID=MMETSP0092-20131115/48771_1 /ASSEMBLY_ACC=CAM_ASM_001090 /TAXON_ID=426623 /ORGANISM="Chaetoceros affinis, Strain CCMP159" /LENGTH=31 /DNA_ID= /DNA_START= /DNA_END= /DNA_ORIENTATION=
MDWAYSEEGKLDMCWILNVGENKDDDDIPPK